MCLLKLVDWRLWTEGLLVIIQLITEVVHWLGLFGW
jgi:hypothetical protein